MTEQELYKLIEEAGLDAFKVFWDKLTEYQKLQLSQDDLLELKRLIERKQDAVAKEVAKVIAQLYVIGAKRLTPKQKVIYVTKLPVALYKSKIESMKMKQAALNNQLKYLQKEYTNLISLTFNAGGMTEVEIVEAYERYKKKVVTPQKQALRKAISDTRNAVTDMHVASGVDVFYYTAHSSARPACAEIQGGLVTTNEEGFVHNKVYIPSVHDYAYREPAGCQGINCRHDMIPRDLDDELPKDANTELSKEELLENAEAERKANYYRNKIAEYKAISEISKVVNPSLAKKYADKTGVAIKKLDKIKK